MICRLSVFIQSVLFLAMLLDVSQNDNSPASHSFK